MKRLLLILALIASPVWAVQPDEILDDPALEQRARDLSTGLRCLVCRNESIDESNADLARDLRLLLRERLVAGDTDEEAIAFIVDRYGEYVLLKPTTSGANVFLWLAGPVMLLLALWIGIRFLLVRAVEQDTAEAKPDALSEDEQERLRRILED